LFCKFPPQRFLYHRFSEKLDQRASFSPPAQFCLRFASSGIPVDPLRQTNEVDRLLDLHCRLAHRGLLEAVVNEEISRSIKDLE
jgi:hypothetical protein